MFSHIFSVLTMGLVSGPTVLTRQKMTCFEKSKILKEPLLEQNSILEDLFWASLSDLTSGFDQRMQRATLF